MANKIEKALYGPSMLEVILGAVLGLFAGVLAASVYLVFKPVLPVKALPKEPARGMVYYLPGAETKAKSLTWAAKQSQFLAGTSVMVVEEELNAWAASRLGATPAPTKPAKAAKSNKPDAADSGPVSDAILIPARPNFRIVDGKLQIGLNCTLNWYGVMTDVTVQSTGGFKQDGDRVVFVPELVYLGSCPLHLLPGVSGLLLDQIVAKERIPDEVRVAWTKLSEVAVEGQSLKLAVR